MKRIIVPVIVLMVSGLAATAAQGSQANTGAWASSGHGAQPGTAGATAQYQGDLGLANTYSQSGQVNLSRGVAVGVDREGASLSVSYAAAPKGGPGVAGTFNLSVGNDGRVSGGNGQVVASGGYGQRVEAGGATRTGGHAPATTVTARGRTWGGGQVNAQARTYGESARPLRHAVPHGQIARIVR